MSATVKLPGSSSEFSLELDLAHPIIPDKCITKVLGSKVSELCEVLERGWELCDKVSELCEVLKRGWDTAPGVPCVSGTEITQNWNWEDIVHEIRMIFVNECGKK